MCPIDVIAVGEEFVVCDGDEDGGSGGLLTDTVESGFDGIEKCRVETVFVIV